MNKLKTFLKIAIVIIAASFLGRYFWALEDEMEEKNAVYLNNNIAFGGIVSDIKISNSHILPRFHRLTILWFFRTGYKMVSLRFTNRFRMDCRLGIAYT
jgi:hypothetical protein